MLLPSKSVRAVIAFALSISILPACAKREVEASAETGATAAPAAEATATPGTAESTIVEEGELGTITWSVTQDGHVEAVVKRPDGAQVTKEVTGIVTWPGEAADEQREMTLTAEGRLIAQGPALESDLNEIDYALVIEGKPWNGVLHVPRDGTRAIAADARAETAIAVPVGKKGPNGGVIQVIGGEPMEVVADSTTGEMRVYMLGPNFEVVDPGERRIRLGYVADYAETLEMDREPGGLYFVSRVRTRIDPVRITLAVSLGSQVHVGIVGFHAGMRLGVGVRAPVIPVMVERRWAPSVAVRGGVGVHVGVGVGGRVRVDERVRVGVHERVRVNQHVDVRGRDNDHDHGHGHVHSGSCGHGSQGGGGQVKVHVNQHVNVHEKGGGRGGPSHGSHGGGGKGKKH